MLGIIAIIDPLVPVVMGDKWPIFREISA